MALRDRGVCEEAVICVCQLWAAIKITVHDDDDAADREYSPGTGKWAEGKVRNCVQQMLRVSGQPTAVGAAVTVLSYRAMSRRGEETEPNLTFREICLASILSNSYKHQDG